MTVARIDIASIRREQIVDAAVAVIAEQGLQNLSLSEIERKIGMSRGQLTYYFKTKEDILLAVFDRLLLLMYQRIGKPGGLPDGQPCQGHEHEGHAWDWIEHLLRALVTQTPVSPEFNCLQYTFLSQIGYREDFRARLAKLYEEWRGNMGQGLEIMLKRRPPDRPFSARAFASVVQAVLHGLGTQLAADPNAFDRQEVLDLCLHLFGSYLGVLPPARPRKKKTRAPAVKNGRSR